MTAAAIITLVEGKLGMDPGEAKALGCTKEQSWARCIASHEIHNRFPAWSLKRIALALGYKHHSMTIHWRNRYEWFYATKPEFRSLAKQIHEIVHHERVSR